MDASDLKKAQELSARLSSLKKKQEPRPVPKLKPRFVPKSKPMKPIPKVSSHLSIIAKHLKDEIINEVKPVKGRDYFDGAKGEKGDRGPTGDISNISDVAKVVASILPPPEPIAPIEIAEKLNTLPASINAEVIKNIPKITARDVVEEIKNLKGNDRIDVSHLRNGENLARVAERASGGFNMNDQRWHGGGSSSGGGVQSVTGLNTDNTDPANPVVNISVDGITITGAGTPGNPLVGSATTSPGGSNTQVQFNDSNTFGGEPGFTFDKAGGNVTINSSVPLIGTVYLGGDGSNLATSGFISYGNPSFGIQMGGATSASVASFIAEDFAYLSTLDQSAQTANHTFAFPDKDGTFAMLSDITGGSPSAPDTSIQFNDGGNFGGDANLTWDKTNEILIVGSSMVATSLDAFGDAYSTGTDMAVYRSDVSGPQLIVGNTIGFKYPNPGGPSAIFNGPSISTDRTFTLQDKSGTIALLSDLNWNVETPTGAIDGVNTTFTISNVLSVANSDILVLGGSVQNPLSDYTLVGTTITYAVAPSMGNTHFIKYQ